jgi:AraC family transcriptional regulator
MTSAPLRVRVRNGPAVAHYPPGATLGPRVLPCYEFVWMLSGRARWHYADAEHVLSPGALLLSRPGSQESYSWDADRSCAHAFVSFHVDSYGALDPSHGWPLIRPLATPEPLAALCHYLLWLSGTDRAGAQERVLDVLGWLLDVFVNGPTPDEGNAALPDHVAGVVEYIRTAWHAGTARPLTLHEMASAARVSPGHLARIFRRRFGLGPVAAVELVRLARASVLLQRSDLTIAAVSDACGFANPFHFSRRFRAAYGAAPSIYRATGPRDPLDPARRWGLQPFAQRLISSP